MRTRPPRDSRPPVRLIPFSRTTSGGAGRPAPATGPRPFRHPPLGGGLGPPSLSRPHVSPPALHAVPAAAEERPEDDLPSAAMAAARVFAEVIAGLRPLHHLAGRSTPEVYDRLGRTLPPARPAGRHAGGTLRVTVPLVQVPLPGVAEVSAVVFAHGHAQALALRLERSRGRWRCAAVETTLSPRQLRDRLAHPAHRPGTAA